MASLSKKFTHNCWKGADETPRIPKFFAVEYSGRERVSLATLTNTRRRPSSPAVRASFYYATELSAAELLLHMHCTPSRYHPPHALSLRRSVEGAHINLRLFSPCFCERENRTPLVACCSWHRRRSHLTTGCISITIIIVIITWAIV